MVMKFVLLAVHLPPCPAFRLCRANFSGPWKAAAVPCSIHMPKYIPVLLTV